MKLPEFMLKLKNEIEAVPKRKIKDAPYDDFVIDLITEIYLDDLNRLIENYSINYTDVSADSLKSFYHYLDNYKLETQNINCLMHPDLYINKVNHILANNLPEAIDEKKIVYSPESKRVIKKYLSEFDPEDFFLADDGSTPIHIAKSFEQVLHKGTFTHTRQGWERINLSKNEIRKLINHSSQTLTFAMQWLPNDITLGYSSLQSDTHENYINMPYTIKNRNDIIQLILKKRGSNLKQLAYLFSTHLPIDKWEAFIGEINDKNLFLIISDSKRVVALVRQQDNYNGQLLHDKATLFCLSEVLRREYLCRKEQQNNTHSYAVNPLKLFSSSVHEFFRPNVDNLKLNLISYYQQGLLNPRLPLSGLENFVWGHVEKNTDYWALYNGRLKIFIDQAKDLGIRMSSSYTSTI